jgi:hypothetical protein
LFLFLACCISATASQEIFDSITDAIALNKSISAVPQSLPDEIADKAIVLKTLVTSVETLVTNSGVVLFQQVLAVDPSRFWAKDHMVDPGLSKNAYMLNNLCKWLAEFQAMGFVGNDVLLYYYYYSTTTYTIPTTTTTTTATLPTTTRCGLIM